MNKTFKARPSLGGLWLILISLALVVMMFFPLLGVNEEIPSAVLIINLSIIVLLAGPLIFFAFQLPRIRYELLDDHLYIHMGKLIRYRILYEEIKQVSKKNLQITLWSSFRLPGLALFTVLYADEGRVKMCATAASQGILLIETETGKYGITPEDQELFVNLLSEKLDK